ncbi:cytochrome P450, partial [Mesorhizobium sp. M7A.F.Ca.CA.004.11.1.1]
MSKWTPTALAFDPATRHLRLDPHEPAFFQNPYDAYAFLHGVSNAFFWEEFGFWCFGGFDDVNRLLRDRRFGRQNPAGIPDSRGIGQDRSHLRAFDGVEANSMLELEPPVHTRLRTLVNRAFVSRQVERLRARVEALANELIDRFEPGKAVDLLPAFAAPLPITIIAEMLGVPVEMGPQLLDWSHQMVAMYMHGRTRAIEETANRAAREFADFLRGYVTERRRNPGDDLLSLLISAQEDGERLSEDEMVSSAILLLNAGHEATVHQTGNAVRSILM